MKRIIIAGIVIWLTGMILMLMPVIVGANLAPHMHSWDSHYGRFWTAVIEGNLMPLFVIGTIFAIVGITILVRISFGKIIFPKDPSSNHDDDKKGESK